MWTVKDKKERNIWSYHSGIAEDSSVLLCDAVWLGQLLATFRGNVVAPSSGSCCAGLLDPENVFCFKGILSSSTVYRLQWFWKSFKCTVMDSPPFRFSSAARDIKYSRKDLGFDVWIWFGCDRNHLFLFWQQEQQELVGERGHSPSSFAACETVHWCRISGHVTMPLPLPLLVWDERSNVETEDVQENWRGKASQLCFVWTCN